VFTKLHSVMGTDAVHGVNDFDISSCQIGYDSSNLMCIKR
jgi:hypothetical protein